MAACAPAACATSKLGVAAAGTPALLRADGELGRLVSLGWAESAAGDLGKPFVPVQ